MSGVKKKRMKSVVESKGGGQAVRMTLDTT